MGVVGWNWLISKAVDGLSSPSFDGHDEIAAFEHAIRKQSLMITVALGTNVSVAYNKRRTPHLNWLLQFVVGDAVVWWRACVIWQHKAVNHAGLLLLTFTTSKSQALIFAGSSPLYLTPPMFAA